MIAKYYSDLNISIPVGDGYWATLHENDAYASFSEIFIEEEYKDYMPNKTPINILDIGAHYGYFSLWLQSRSPNEKIRSILVEPSSTCKRSLESLVNYEKLGGRFYYLPGAISDRN